MMRTPANYCHIHKQCFTILRGTIVNRIYGTVKNLLIYLFFLTIFGPIYYGPP